MKDNNEDFKFDDKEIKKVYRKATIKSTIRIILIVIVVVVPLYIIISKINMENKIKLINSYYEEQGIVLELTNPNSYISMAKDSIGLLNTNGSYKVSKKIGRRAVELYEQKSSFGLVGANDKNSYNRLRGAGGHHAGEWPISFDKGGNLTMQAFHPDIQYKEYKNDLALINKLSQDSLVEVTLSFDKKYKIYEILNIIPKANISQVLIDGYTDDELTKYKQEAIDWDGKASFIRQYEFVGFAIDNEILQYGINVINQTYSKYLENLQYNFKCKENKDNFKKIYDVLKNKEQLTAENLDVIGVVIYGTPEELNKLKDSPHIKASSVGIVTKDIIFK